MKGVFHILIEENHLDRESFLIFLQENQLDKKNYPYFDRKKLDRSNLLHFVR